MAAPGPSPSPRAIARPREPATAHTRGIVPPPASLVASPPLRRNHGHAVSSHRHRHCLPAAQPSAYQPPPDPPLHRIRRPLPPPPRRLLLLPNVRLRLPLTFPAMSHQCSAPRQALTRLPACTAPIVLPVPASPPPFTPLHSPSPCQDENYPPLASFSRVIQVLRVVQGR